MVSQGFQNAWHLCTDLIAVRFEETDEAAVASGAEIEGEAAGWAKLERVLAQHQDTWLDETQCMSEDAPGLSLRGYAPQHLHSPLLLP